MLIPERLMPLKDALDKSSGVNRNLGLVFSSFLVYVLIIVVSTTDRQLLIPDEGIQLPILNIELPLFGFYIVAPALVLILHLNLLINLLKHSEKLYEWQEEMGRKAIRARHPSFKRSKRKENDFSKLLPPFIFNFVIGQEPDQFSYYVIRGLVYISSFLFPLLLLAYIQLRFSDYQSVWMTSYHWVLVLADVVFLASYQARILKSASSLSKHIARRSLRFLISAKLWRGLILGLCTISLSLIVWIISEKHPHLKDFSGIRFFPRLGLSGQILVKEAPPKEYILSKEEAGIPLDSIWISYVTPLSLSGRNLNYANLRGSKLFKSVLISTQLKGANLIEAQLQGTDLRAAGLQGTYLYKAQLQGAKLFKAQLQGADLRAADLQGVNLSEAQLQGAHLSKAQLQGANLFYAQLQEATLMSADLQGANLYGAQLQGANLSGAQLQGTDLRVADLQGADLDGVQLQRALLSGVDLQGADLRAADLQGVLLDGALLQAALFYRASIRGIDMRRSKLGSTLFVTPDTNTAINFDSLIQVILPTLMPKDTAIFITRMKSAKEHLSTQPPPVNLPEDENAFVAYRAKMFCDWKYDIRSLFIGTHHVEDTLAFRLNTGIRNHIQLNCPEKLEKLENVDFEYEGIEFSDEE